MRSIVHSVIKVIRDDHASVMKNFFSLTFLKGLEYLVPLILVPYLVRTLGLERYGTVQTAVSFMYIFLVITNFGFNYSAAREISINRDNPEKASRIAGAIIALKSLLMCVSFIIMLFMAISLPSLNSELGLVIITFGFIIGDVLFPVWLYQGYEKMYYLSRFQIIARIILFIGVLSLVHEPEDYLLYPSLYYGTQVIMAISTLGFAHRLLGVKVRMPSLAIMKEQFRLGIRPFLSSVAQVLYTQPRVFYVSLISTKLITGTYAIADKAAGVFQLFPVWLFVISALPKLSYMFEHDREECLQTLRTYQQWTVIYALMSTPIIVLTAPWIIYVFSGEYNDQAAMYFRLLCIETFILTINIFLIHYFPIAGKFGVFAKIYGITCLITLGLFFFLSQAFGVLGLIWGIIASSLILLILTIYFRKKEIMARL